MSVDAAALSGDWSYPTRIRFGPGRIAELPLALAELAAKRLLLVTDPGLRELDLVAEVERLLIGAGLDVATYSDIQANPVGADVEEGVERFRAERCDAVVALGGGSSLDAGKAIALMTGQVRPIFDFEDREDWSSRVDPTGVAPVLAIPTTAGTGSEVGRAAVITDEVGPTKKIIFHSSMMPKSVIADPELTVGLPSHLTAATGMDALAHNLEAFCAPGFHPMADGIALEGLRLIATWLPRAVEDGSDLRARAHMLAAASMGAVAFQKGLGAVHALSHPVGAVLGVHHGLLNGVLLPYVLSFNRSAIQEKLPLLGRSLGRGESFDDVLDWLLRLRAEIGIPSTLKALGVSEEMVEQLAPMAAEDPTCAGNPVPVGESELASIYLNAIQGLLG